MKMKIGFAFVVCLVIATISCIVFGLRTSAIAQNPPAKSALTVPRAVSLGIKPRSELLKQVGKTATFEGYYYNGSTPMIVENMELLNAETDLPPNKYVLLGTAPTGVQSGSKIRVTGSVRKPGTSDSDILKSQDVYLAVADTKAVTKLQAPAAIQEINLQFPEMQAMPQPTQGKKYAVLIAGGMNYANNYPRYWNDAKFMYYALKNRGYQPSDIYVFYANGMPKDGYMPLRGPSAYGSIAAVFNHLANKMNTTDKLYIGLFGQGGPPVPDTNHDEPYSPYVDHVFWLWNGVRMTDDMLAAQVNKITKYSKMVIQLNQSYSGGFVNDLTRPNRIVLASSLPSQSAYAHPSGYFGHMNYWLISSFLGRQIIGSTPLNADANGNGKVSIVEAYNLARVKVLPHQTMVYEDNGVVPFHTGPMPGGGEGALGVSIHL